MTSAFLQSELASLISDSKKKFGEVKTAAEKSLSDLKSITVTSEIQLAADLARKPQFIDPFVQACKTKSPKLANSATASLQRLVASRAIPTDRLEEVLNALKDVVNASYDVQLKILQTLPALLQLYSAQIHGQLLARTLEICATLQSSKTALVSSSAGATLGQLIASVFEEASQEQATAEPEADNNGSSESSASTSADDAGRLFEDLCSTLNQTEPTFIMADSLSPAYLVETLEKIIDGNATYIKSKPYLIEACRSQLIPALTGLLESRDDFAFLVLLLDASYVLLHKLAPLLFLDMKPILSIILGFTDRDAGPLWKRALALEFLSRTFSNFGLVARLFDELREDKAKVIINALATFVRIASEDPTLIGLGRQSTAPAQRGETREDDMAAIEAHSVGGLASVTSADAGVTGISLEYSAMETTLLDTADSSRLNSVPKTYPHTLILECISSFCEGLSKFIMPLSVMAKSQDDQDVNGDNVTNDQDESTVRTPSQRRQIQKHKYQRLANPLNLKELPQLPQVEACARMIESCWPAILAMCSTFLNAALDSHYYHVLIRSIQKLAQVSGTLELGTPRDALLTSLAKGSVPANAGSIIQLSSPVAKRESENEQSYFSDGLKSPALDATKGSLEPPKQTLNVRHLLCLRALLNLGIALGPTLGHESWFIVIETLQQVEALMAISSTARRTSGTGQDGQTTLSGEMVAVNTASKRMFDSTRSYTDDAFGIVAGALFRLMGEEQPATAEQVPEPIASPATLASPAITSPTVRKHGHKASRSVSGLWGKTHALDVEVAFVFTKLKDLARVNLHRFASAASQQCTWDLVVARLLKAAKTPDLTNSLRLQASSTIDLIAKDTLKLLEPSQAGTEEVEKLQRMGLEALAAQVGNSEGPNSSVEIEHSLTAEITKMVFEALEDILGHCGETLRSGWKVVFIILKRSFASDPVVADGDNIQGHAQFTASTPVAFRCVQLVCNDFIDSLDVQSLGLLISLLYLFGSQQQELNMALSTTGLLRNIATLLQRRLDAIEVTEEDFSEATEPTTSGLTELQLWCATLTELAKLCSDPRREVRDTSLRILLQTIEGSSGQLTPSSWGPLLEAVPFSISQGYQSAITQEDVDHKSVEATAAHLLEGTTNLIVQNIEAMAKDQSFPDTWSRMLDIFNVTLEAGELATFALVYSCVAQLLKAINPLSIDHAPFVKPALLLWTWHPVPEHQKDGKDEPNQAALTAHLHMFVEAHTTSSAMLRGFSHHRRSISEYATTAIRQTLLTATHAPYTNDVKTMTSEQQEVIGALEILKSLFSDTKELENFSGYVLELIQDMLDIEKGNLKPRPTHASASKKHQKPTFIAVSSHCIDLLRNMTVEVKGSADFASTMQLPYALDMLSAIIKTKYTSLPTNAVAPLWRNASTTAVMLLEATAQPPTNEEELTDLAQTITATLTAILGPGGLPAEPTSKDPSNDTLLTDEAFDTSHFQRLHRAALPLVCGTAPATLRPYILCLFNASLICDPWHNDLPSPEVLLNSPLTHLSTIRPGTVHTPTPVRRQTLALAALDALFALLDPARESFRGEVATQAAPYVLLRIALPLKSFLADQRLRGWTAMPQVLRVELLGVLERAVALRGDDAAFDAAVAKHAGNGDRKRDGNGKAHLRALFGLLLKVQVAWRTAMRVPGGAGWMEADGGEGSRIEALLEKWVENVGEGWGLE